MEYNFNSQRLRFDYNNMMKERVEAGVSLADIDAFSNNINNAISAMDKKRTLMSWRRLPYMDQSVIDDIKSTADDIIANFDSFVVLGIGGSALGPIAVHNALNHAHYNELNADIRKTPKFYVEDNIDPTRMTALFDVINPKRTMFNIITKSGATSETMSQFLIITHVLKEALGDDFSNNIIATTDANKGNLIKIAHDFNIKTFYIPDGVGGRFSELCPVGLLPAAVCGIDISALLCGARHMDEIIESSTLYNNPSYMYGLLHVLSMKKNKNITVLMPYSDQLKYISDWYAQLWAESLAKRSDNNGNDVFVGQTPIKALGVTDQHSQVQLYTQGPNDKVFTLIGIERYAATMNIPHEFTNIPDVAFLCGHTQNELISAELTATEYALTKSGRCNCMITLDTIDAFTIGELLYMFEVATAFAGELLDIDAFNQPGVEEGKNATYALLNKPGFDSKREELANVPQKFDKYILKF